MPLLKKFDRQAPDVIASLDVDGRADRRRGAGYLASERLEHAVNTALILGRPLLLSGEPGCGKTELGFSVARKLGISNVYFFAVKSDSEAQRLFYEFDAVRRFHAAQAFSSLSASDPAALDPRNFIRYQALGLAILAACPAESVAHLRLTNDKVPEAPVRSVVVIDEIDKAPRDFPNDLLNELDQLWFRVPELAGWVTEPSQPEIPRGAMDASSRPIVVMTSNLERQLPDAFLRRCVFHHIEHPTDQETQRAIVHGYLEKHSAALANSDLTAAIEFVAWARTQNLEKAPGLSELLEFARAIASERDPSNEVFAKRAARWVSSLGKTTRDQNALLDGLVTWQP